MSDSITTLLSLKTASEAIMVFSLFRQSATPLDPNIISTPSIRFYFQRRGSAFSFGHLESECITLTASGIVLIIPGHQSQLSDYVKLLLPNYEHGGQIKHISMKQIA